MTQIAGNYDRLNVSVEESLKQPAHSLITISIPVKGGGGGAKIALRQFRR